jgi:WhiB family redox-sensing transcriptional regulator
MTLLPPALAALPDLLDEERFARPFEFPEWMADASCASTDPDAFFPEKGGSTRMAKLICSRCPVAAECLDYALDNGEKFGIWGGVSERDRRKIQHALHPDPKAATA